MAGESFDKGRKIRSEVLGNERVERALGGADSFSRPYQEIMTAFCWGEVWGRDGLPRKTRSLLNIAMLAALNRDEEYRLHVRGAFNNGVTKEEIQEVLLQVMIYCGVPAANAAFRMASDVFAEMEQEGR